MKLIHVFKYFVFAIPSLLFPFITLAQSFQYQPDKPGTFIFNNKPDKSHGLDAPTVQNKLTIIVEWNRHNNPVVDHPICFDALVGITGYYSDSKPKKEDWKITLENFTANCQLKKWVF
jgi:hypothetical protein